MRIREATEGDLEVVAELRLRFLAEHRGIDPAGLSPAFRTTTLDFLRRHAEAKTSRSWLAEHDGAIVGVATMLVLDLAPRPDDTSGFEGYLINMYVEPEHRGRGFGRALLDAALAEAQTLGLRRLLLYATADGRPLYERAGFAPNPAWMERPV